MKNKFLILLILIFVSNETFPQNPSGEEKKVIGRVNLAGDANYILQYSILDEQHLYEIIDNKNSGSTLKSFKLIFNDQTVFQQNLLATLDDIDIFDDKSDIKKTVKEESQKYYYAFHVMRPAVNEAAKGPIAMTMKFGQTAEIRKSVNGSSDYVKRKNLIIFLNENKLIDTEKDLDYYYSMPHLKFKKEYKNYTKQFSFSDIQKNARGNLMAYLSISEINSILKLEDGENSRYISFYAKLNKDLFDGLRSLEKTRNTGPNYNKKALAEYQKYLSESKTFLFNKIKDAIDIRNDSIKDYANSISLNDSIIGNLAKEEELFNNILKIYTEKRNNTKINIDGIEAKLVAENHSIETFRNRIASLENEMISSEESIIIVSMNTEIEKKIEIIEILTNSLSDSTNVLNEYEELIRINSNRIDNFKNSIEEIKEQNQEKTISKKINEDFIKKIENIFALELFAAGLLEVKITNIQFEFNNGFLENMIVMTEPIFDFNFDENLIKPTDKFIKFTNQYPLGFSSKTDLENLRRIELYAVQDKKVEYVLDFKDVVINIEEILELNRKDYSPKNKAVKDINPETTKERDFHKDNSTQILEAKIFSDLSGINATKPNGLIQLEVDKVIPLLTNRRTKSDTYWPFRWMINKNNNYGFFNYIKPEFTWSKIEQNLRSLDLKLESKQVISEIDTTTVNTLYASTLDIRQFEMLSVGADLNIWFLDLPYAKSSFYLNAGFRFGRTLLTLNDSVSTNEFGMKGFTNTFQFMPEFGYKINGDERYGLDFSYSPNWIISDSRGFIQTSDTFGIFETNETFSHQQQNKLHRLTLLAYFNITPSTTGRLFFRFRSFHQWKNWSNNFTQYQLGYSFFLTR